MHFLDQIYEAPRANARGIFSLASAERNLAEAENSHSSTVWQPWSSAKADKQILSLGRSEGIIQGNSLVCLRYYANHQAQIGDLRT